MFRYVALVWDESDSAARARAGMLAQRLRASSPEWGVALDRDGLQVFCAGVRTGSSEPYALHGGTGIVLGKLFQRIDGGPSKNAPLQLSEAETHQVIASGGRRLVHAYWGRYVAFLRDDSTATTHVLRDPTASLPCLAMRFDGVDVYCSRMEDVSQLDGRSFSINWKYVAGTLCQARLQVHATGLNEVKQVLGGECVQHRDGEARRQFYWNPLEIAQSNVISNPAEAAAVLRETTRDCVQAWASSYRSILHLLSGGLDSSIILSCLRDAPARPKMACLNYHSPGSNTDEREYAQLAASGAGCEVIERQRNSNLSLEPLLRVRKSAVPGDYFFYLDEGRCEAELAREHEATAVFSGYGGDQLFYQSRARFAAGDFLTSHGAGSGLFQVALDAARVDRLSVWSVLGQAACTALTRRPWSARHDSAMRLGSLVRDEVAHDISRDSDLEHPWLRGKAGTPNGKRWHAYQLLFPLDFYNPLGATTDPEPVTPLLSQPLQELAMRIPTWLLTRGGWDRAMARRAFEHDIPRPIVIRRTKGGQEEHAKAILFRNIGIARELLLEGRLVREGILEERQVAEALSPGPSRRGAGNAELYGCLSAEAWLRQWTAA